MSQRNNCRRGLLHGVLRHRIEFGAHITELKGLVEKLINLFGNHENDAVKLVGIYNLSVDPWRK